MSKFALPFTGFDIETEPAPELVEKFTEPFPEFDASAVKMGNLKDPVKRAEKLREAQAEHEAAREAYRVTSLEQASLNPFTGRICAIGYVDEEATWFGHVDSEKEMLAYFWARFTEGGEASRRFVYWSGAGGGAMSREKTDTPTGRAPGLDHFDLDFIVTRSRLVGVNVPGFAFRGRYYSERFVDLSAELLLHRRGSFLSLSKAAELFGLYGEDGKGGPTGEPMERTIYPKSKNDPVTGKNFHKWLRGDLTGESEAVIAQAESRTPEGRYLFALRYLRNDVMHLFHLAPRIL
jgi:hypothetical protein